VGTTTDDLYVMTDNMATGDKGFRFETPVWDKYVKDCWHKAQTGIDQCCQIAVYTAILLKSSGK
jgi:hypothetical protein